MASSSPCINVPPATTTTASSPNQFSDMDWFQGAIAHAVEQMTKESQIEAAAEYVADAPRENRMRIYEMYKSVGLDDPVQVLMSTKDSDFACEFWVKYREDIVEQGEQPECMYKIYKLVKEVVQDDQWFMEQYLEEKAYRATLRTKKKRRLQK